MKDTGRPCASCKRGHGELRIRDGLRVLICDECNADWFRRERVFMEARGEAWDAAVAGRPKA
jgi:hypothetical protein